ncbi:MAG TPA: hypothetical protein VF797_23450, partial [Noviherbaspirillum sp.]
MKGLQPASLSFSLCIHRGRRPPAHDKIPGYSISAVKDFPVLSTANITMQFGPKPLFENISVK